MKRIIAIALFAASTLATAGRLSAQDQALRATIPFDFTLNNKLLPAGTYKISPWSPNTVMVRNQQNNIAALSTGYADGRKSATPVLVFHKYGDQYFLSEVVDNTRAAMNLTMPLSKLERRVQIQEAGLRGSSETLIALK